MAVPLEARAPRRSFVAAGVALVTAWLALGSPLPAQPPLATGTRLRVLVKDTLVRDGAARTDGAAGGGWRIGAVVSAVPPTLTLETSPPGRRDAIPLAAVTRIDVSRGRPTRRGRGAVVGGLLSGGAFVGLACAFSDGSCRVGDDVGGFLLYFATGAIPGVIVGRSVGSRMRGPERWETLWTAPPTRGGRSALER